MYWKILPQSNFTQFRNIFWACERPLQEILCKLRTQIIWLWF